MPPKIRDQAAQLILLPLMVCKFLYVCAWETNTQKNKIKIKDRKYSKKNKRPWRKKITPAFHTLNHEVVYDLTGIYNVSFIWGVII